MNGPEGNTFDQYPDLDELRKYWSICIVVPEGQHFNNSNISPYLGGLQAVGVPKFLYNSSLFSKVLFLLFVNNYEAIPDSFWKTFIMFTDVTDYMPSNLRTISELKTPELFSIVGAMLSRHGTKVVVVDKEEILYPTLKQNRTFTPFIHQNRLQFISGGLASLSYLNDPDMFVSGPAFDLPTPTEVVWMKDIFKKMLENQLRNAPKDCIKLARTVETLVRGKTQDGKVINKLVILVLSECFANGVIENDLIYQEISTGAVRNIKDLEGFDGISVNQTILNQNGGIFPEPSAIPRYKLPQPPKQNPLPMMIRPGPPSYAPEIMQDTLGTEQTNVCAANSRPESQTLQISLALYSTCEIQKQYLAWELGSSARGGTSRVMVELRQVSYQEANNTILLSLRLPEINHTMSEQSINQLPQFIEYSEQSIAQARTVNSTISTYYPNQSIAQSLPVRSGPTGYLGVQPMFQNPSPPQSQPAFQPNPQPSPPALRHPQPIPQSVQQIQAAAQEIKIVPKAMQLGLFAFTVEFTQQVVRCFETSNFHGIKKFDKFKNAILNLLRNEVVKRLGKKTTSESEKNIMTELKTNDDKAKTGRDPDATYYSVILCNMFAFLTLQTSALAFPSNTDVKCDLEVMRILASEQIHTVFKEPRMSYSITQAVQCMRSPSSTLASFVR